MNERRQYQETMQRHLNELASRIDGMLSSVEAKARAEYDALPQHLRKMQDGLDRMKQSSSEAWTDLKPGMEKAWKELRASVERASERFR